jgi:hypothetical protein
VSILQIACGQKRLMVAFLQTTLPLLVRNIVRLYIAQNTSAIPALIFTFYPYAMYYSTRWIVDLPQYRKTYKIYRLLAIVMLAIAVIVQVKGTLPRIAIWAIYLLASTWVLFYFTNCGALALCVLGMSIWTGNKKPTS